MVVSSLLIISTQIGFYYVGNWIFKSKLQGDQREEVESSSDQIIKHIFNITMSASLTLLQLLILELIDIFPRSTRLFFWRINLTGLLSLLIFIVPFFQLKLSISNRFGKNSFKIIIFCKLEVFKSSEFFRKFYFLSYKILKK